MTLAPDEDLMLQVRDGADETLGVLFDRYQTPLFNFYSKLTGDPSSQQSVAPRQRKHRASRPEYGSLSRGKSRAASLAPCVKPAAPQPTGGTDLRTTVARLS